jgi:virulence factor Mce-like protein
MPRPTFKAAMPAIASLFALAACSLDPYSLPLPGGPDVGGHPKEVTIDFHDATDLTKQGAVRVDDVAVGRITDVELNGWTAQVTVKIDGDVKLPANATATIRQSSLLGEKFVSIERPDHPTGVLASGDTIGLERTGRNPDLEEVLGAASLLFNGGGLEKTNTIVKEVNKALDGNEPQVKALLRTADAFLSQLDASKGQILATLRQVNRLTSGVNAQKNAIDAALANLPGALRVLDDQRDDLVSMLKALDRLGQSSTGVVRAMKADLIANLQSIEPILHYLTAAADNLSGNVSTVLTFPFPDSIVGGSAAAAKATCDNSDVAHSSTACWGDWYNLVVNFSLDTQQVCTGFGLCLGGLTPASATAAQPSSAGAGTAGLLDLVAGLVPQHLPGPSPTPSTTASPTPVATGGPLCTLLGICRAPAASSASSTDLAEEFGLGGGP